MIMATPFTLPFPVGAAPGLVQPQAPAEVMLSDEPEPDKFVLLAGQPYHGKTRSALTFPDPFVLDLANRLPRAGIPNAPFWKPAFVDKLSPRVSAVHPPNVRDALMAFIVDNQAMLADKTAILDGLGEAETAFHQQTEDVEKVKANVGGGILFGKKLSYFNGLFATLARVARRVVVTCHLAPIYRRDDTTGADMPTGKSRPMMTGQFAERIAGYTTAMILCQANSEYDAGAGQMNTSYWWYIKPTQSFDARIRKEGVYPDKIKPEYSEFRKLWT